MTYYETIKEMQNNLVIDTTTIDAIYFNAEETLTTLTCSYIANADVMSITHGSGVIVKASGRTFDAIIVDIAFAAVTKRFSLKHMITNTKFIQFTDQERYEPLLAALALHESLDYARNNFDLVQKLEQAEAAKKKEAEARAEAKYAIVKEKTIKNFEILMSGRSNITVDNPEKFYYMLGWLTNNINTITVAVPDYLLARFEERFGTEVKPKVIDSSKKIASSFSTKGVFSLATSFKKSAIESIPEILTPYISTTGKGIADITFMCELINIYGFTFSKKQDADKIRQTIPTRYTEFFDAGLGT